MSSFYFTDAPFFSFSDIQRFVDDPLSLPSLMLENPAASRVRERGEERGLTPTMRQWQPRMDLHENTEENTVTAMIELAGLKKEDVHIEVQNNRLIISGEVSEQKDTSEKDFVLRERRRGRFSRVLPVPLGLKASDVKATMEHGVLCVTFPKRTEEQIPQRVTIL